MSDAHRREMAARGAARFVEDSSMEHMRKRSEMLEWLTKAHLAKFEGWALVEERSADGLRTTWHFEQHKHSTSECDDKKGQRE